MLLTWWLYLLVYGECSLNGVFQPASSFESIKSLLLRLHIDDMNFEDPLFGLCHELRQMERSNSLEEIVIKIITTSRLQHDFLTDLNDVLTLPGYTKLRCLRLEILLLAGTAEDFDKLNDATQAQCSQLFNRPSLNFSYRVAVEGVDDHNIFLMM
jgi:hypothetical protein